MNSYEEQGYMSQSIIQDTHFIRNTRGILNTKYEVKISQVLGIA